MLAETHNGIITINNPETGKHRTFQIRTQKTDASFAPGARILSLLSGPNNGSDYTSIGIVKDDGNVTMWKKHRESSLMNKYVDMVMNPVKYASKVEYLWEGKCRCCNRKLTSPESIKSGVGPICGGKE